MAKELTKFESEMKKVLLDERAKLLESIKEREKQDSQKETSNFTSGDEADQRSQFEELVTESSLRAYDLKRLKAIENALGRISAGTYGKCMKCGKKISQERLRAMPQALLCISCKNDTETKKARLDAINKNQRSSEEYSQSDDDSSDGDNENDD